MFKGLDQHSDLRELVADTLTMKPNFSYTIDEVRDNVKRVFNQGYFQSVKPIADDTRDGVKLTLEVCAAHADPADQGLCWQQQVFGGALWVSLTSLFWGCLPCAPQRLSFTKT